MIQAGGVAAVVALVLIGLEFLFSRYCEDHAYESGDTGANLLIAVIGFVVNTAFKMGTLLWFSWVHEFSFLNVTMNGWGWLMLLIAGDLINYIFHYLGHRSRIFWAAHVVHHSSVKYNLTTAVRMPVMNFFYRFVFWTPLCLLGFPPYAVLIAESVIFLYQFWLHTKYIGKLGWLELVFNTPSHHRVHHGSDAHYIDKNFGGILIVWDRLFGTFAEEKEPPTFGITHNIHSNHVGRILFHEWRAIAADLRRERRGYALMKILLGRPAARPHLRPDTPVSEPGGRAKAKSWVTSEVYGA
jgi:sterol desaturase/sphingolipid hydroxylase (fatty acid hydroxylase superfamily)